MQNTRTLALLLFSCLCAAKVLPIVSLRDTWPDGGILQNAEFAFRTGFNTVLVPLQKTRDLYPRLVVSNDHTISSQTMLEFRQSVESRKYMVPLLGEFLGVTASTIQTLLVPIQDHEDVDTIAHEFILSPRSIDSFSLVLSPFLANPKDDHTDAISRYRALVPDGDIVIYEEKFQGTTGESVSLVQQAHKNGVHKVAVPAPKITEELVKMARFNNLSIGAFDVDTDKTLAFVMDLELDFFTTQEAIKYLALTSKRIYKNMNKAHAAVFFG